MTSNRKRILSAACAAALIFSMAACAKGGTASQSAPAPSSAASGSKASSAPQSQSGEKQTIKLWHIFGGDTDPNKAVIDKVTKEAGEKFKTSIEVDTAENEAYKTKIKAAIAANETPDIFFTWGHGFLKPFVTAGKTLALDEYLTADYKSHLGESTLTGFQFDGKTYGLTIDQSVACMFYNKEMFDKNGVAIPKTFDEFLAACRKFKDKGITPLTVGGKEPWTIAMYHDLFALREVGSEGVKKATSKAAGYDDPGFLKAAQDLRKLVDMGAFPDGSAGISREESEVPFFQGQIPMYLNGSWTATRVYKDTSKVQGKVVVAPFPTVSGGKSTAKDFTGGPDTAFAVSAAAKNPKLTSEICQEITLNLAVGKYLIGSSILPYSNLKVDDSKVNPLLMDIYAMTKDATSYTIWWDNLMEGKDSTVYLKKLQELFVGDITPEQYVDALKKLNK